MSYALTELSQLLSPDKRLPGVVMGISGNLVTVATPQGAVSARTLNALSVNDRVIIDNGIATKAPVAKLTFPV